MKIFSWNCHYGFTDTKFKALKSFDSADIYILQECREKDVEIFGEEYQKDWYGDHIEAGDNEVRDLGIGIIARKSSCTISRTEYFDEMTKFRYVLPFKVEDKSSKRDFIVCAVWTKALRDENKKYKNYHIPVYEAFDYEKVNNEKNVVLVGDFNTGSVKDSTSEKWYRILKERLSKKGYINCAGETFEWEPTFFRGNGNWLDDHCFIKTDGLLKNQEFKFGSEKDWIRSEFSDHLPMLLTIE